MTKHDLNLDNAVSVSDAITADHFGANFVYNYERIGDAPWERFDELIEQMGIHNLRYPGGNGVETHFDFTNPNKTINLAGQTVTPLDEFLEFCGRKGLDATIIIPTRAFLPNESHSFLTYDTGLKDWVVDPSALAAIKQDVLDFVRETLEEARSHGTTIYAFELGNEYSGVDWTSDNGVAHKMTAQQYGVMANELAQLTQQAIDDFNAAHSGPDNDPQIVAQIWGDFNQNGFGTNTLDGFNDRVLEGFDADGLAAIDALTHHIYFKDQKTSRDGETHSYETLAERVSDMLSLGDAWNTAAGRELDVLVSEWSVQKLSVFDPGFDYWKSNDTWVASQDWLDHTFYGLRQVAPMLEMFTAFVEGGVDSTHLWSVMYNATALGKQNDGGTLNIGGELVKIMKENLIGTEYVEMDAQTSNHDLHLFTSEDEGHVFVSSLSGQDQTVTLDFAQLEGGYKNVTVTYFKVDESDADGQFTTNGNTYLLPSNNYAYLELDLDLLIETGAANFNGTELSVDLGAYETAYISFDREESDDWCILPGDVELTAQEYQQAIAAREQARQADQGQQARMPDLPDTESDEFIFDATAAEQPEQEQQAPVMMSRQPDLSKRLDHSDQDDKDSVSAALMPQDTQLVPETASLDSGIM